MNPDENNSNQAEGVTPTTPAVPPTPETAPEVAQSSEAEAQSMENLDQVAADLANTAPADVAPDTTPVVEPQSTASEAAPETPATPEAPVAPETPTASEIPTTAEAPNASEVSVVQETPETPTVSTPEVTAMPVSEAIVAPDAPTTSDAPVEAAPFASETMPEATSAPEVSTTPETQTVAEAPTTEPTAEPASEPAADSFSTTSANFVDDASSGGNPEENSEGQPAAPAEDEPPLVPAEPVPGSIGSALAYSDTAPNHTIPVGKIAKAKKERKPLTKENLKLLIAIIVGVTLIAIVAVVIFFIINSGSKTSTTQPATNNTTPTNVVSSLTCTLTGDYATFSEYGMVVSGTEQLIAMYNNDELSSFGTTLTLTYTDEDTAKNGQYLVRDQYNTLVSNAGLTSDPFTSSYDAKGTTVTVTHQAEGADITSQNARILGLYVVKGEPITDIDTLLDIYETDGYTCVEKQKIAKAFLPTD